MFSVLAAKLGSVAEAWRVKNVRLGFVGTTLIALGALSPAYLPRNSPWWQMLTDAQISGWPARLVGTTLTMAGLFLLLDAWFRLRPRPDAGPRAAPPDDSLHQPLGLGGEYSHRRSSALSKTKREPRAGLP